MATITAKQLDREFEELVRQIRSEATPFAKNTSQQIARVKRAATDKLYFAAVFFPHLIKLDEAYKELWKTPDAKVDWVAAGYAPFHTFLFELADLTKQMAIIAGFRESAKSTLLGKIDLIHKLVFEDRWFIPIVSKTDTMAEKKAIPLKLEFEENKRLRQDFGNLVGSRKWENDYFILRNGRAIGTRSRLQGGRGFDSDGHRPDHYLFDDISDASNPDSVEIVNKFVDIVKSSFLKGVNSTRWSAVYLCNYTHKMDITDELMVGKHTTHYSKHIFRALIPNEMETKSDRDIAKKCRDAGFNVGLKSNWESRHRTVDLLREQKNDPDTFDTEMMMRPRARKGQKFADSHFRYHTRAEVAGGNYVYYSAVDPSAKDAGDYKATITVGVGLRPDGETLHIPIVKASIEQQSTDEMLKEGYAQNAKYHPKIFGVEMIGFAILLEREYKRLTKKYGLLAFHKVDTKNESKESRIERLVDYVKDGIITFDMEDAGQELLIQQLKAFPNGGQVSRGGLGDDGPDALEMCVRMIEAFPAFGEYKYETVQRREMQFQLQDDEVNRGAY